MNKYKESKGNFFLRIIGKVISIFIISTISIVLYDMYANISVDSVEIKDVKEEKNEENEEDEKIDIYSVLEEVSKSVVGVSKLQSIDISFFSLEAAKNYNLGTGIIISKEGYVLTNSHIAGNMYTRCYITTEDGKELTGNVVWEEEDLDLSIIKINTTRQMSSYAKLGDSSKINVGQTVYAIGNPLGIEFQRTVTSGIISAKTRTIKIEENNQKSFMEDLIQTDAPINNGNSGGPLIDEKGNVIGITTIKIGEAEGIGFAVPINIIKPIIEELEQTGSYEEASLGIYGYDKEAIQYINSSLEIKSGIYISDLVITGAAKKAGLQIGDIIEKIDGMEINKINELRNYIYTKKVGDEVELMILRGKDEIEKTIQLKKK